MPRPTTPTAAASSGSQTPPFAPRPFWSRPRAGGLGLFVFSYGLALSAPLARGFRDGREWLAVPVTGPILSLVASRDNNPWALVLDEIGQLGGLSLFLSGDAVVWTSASTDTSAPRQAQSLPLRVSAGFALDAW
jgi:hypothetical protein